VIDKGTIANIISAGVLALGFALGKLFPESATSTVVLSAGMFALSGGLTNSIAVKMLFDRIPGLYGSGVIQMRFEEIRAEIKKLVLDQFFNEDQLREYFRRQARGLDLVGFLHSPDGRGPLTTFIEKQWDRLTDATVIEPIIARQLDKFLSGSFGGLLALVGTDAVQGMISKFVSSFISDMKVRVIEKAERIQRDSSSLGIELDEDRVIAKIEEQVALLLDQRLEQLTPRQVKGIVEDVIRRHLGWLVVWGVVFGALMGLVAPFVSGMI